MTISAIEPIPTQDAHLPPRIAGEPLLGHLRAFRNDRLGMQIRLGRSHPFAVSMRLGFFDSLVVSSPAVAHEVLQAQEEAFSKSYGLSIFLRPILGDGLLTSERDFHARQRRLIAPALTPKRIAAYADTMAERTSRTVAGWRQGQTMDVSEAMMRLTLEIVGKTLFDAEVGAEAESVGEALTSLMENTLASMSAILPLPPPVPTRQNRASARATASLDAVIYRLIAERRRDATPRTDLLSMLIAARDADGSAMSDKQVGDEAMTLMLAGHETTAAALSWSIHLLSLHPEARARAEEEVAPFARRGTPLKLEDLRHLPFTLAVIKEAMRFYPPAYIIGRRALRDVFVPGPTGGDRYVIKKGTTVFVNVLGMHRSSALFPDAGTFDPTRFLGDREKEIPKWAYMPFGAGPRICVGNHFALMEAHLLLATILGAVRLDHVPGSEDVGMEPLITLRPKGGVHVRVSRLHRPD